MVNNFDYIREHLSFLNDKSFYFIQILKRKKENPEMKSYSRPIESFYIFNKEQFDVMMPHIIEKCEMNRARAYIKMNCLDAESVMLGQIAELTRIIRDNDWRSMPSSLNSACGQCGKQNGNDKLYLVDLDDEYVDKVDEVKNYINSLEPHKITDKIKMEIPTKHGVHLLATGFDKQTFKQTYTNVDVHDDGITLLYYPSCCDMPKDENLLKYGDEVVIEGYNPQYNGLKSTFIRYDKQLIDQGGPLIDICVVNNMLDKSFTTELRFPKQYIKKLVK